MGRYRDFSTSPHLSRNSNSCFVGSGFSPGLMFGLGMTNNGTGLVIAAGGLAHIPAVMLPVIFYNLIQHVVAGCVDHYWLGGGDKGICRIGEYSECPRS
jgi:hypothetical protein